VRNTSTLGLFNDTYATLGANVAVLLFCHRRWLAGCVVFSAAVAVKMNVLLYAPGLLFLLLVEGGVPFAATHIAACAAVQAAVAAPFLATAPAEYVAAAFDLGRHFTHEWSVNLRFLPEAVFGHRALAAGLLAAHVAVLAALWMCLWRPLLPQKRLWPLQAVESRSDGGRGLVVPSSALAELDAVAVGVEDAVFSSSSGSSIEPLPSPLRSRRKSALPAAAVNSPTASSQNRGTTQQPAEADAGDPLLVICGHAGEGEEEAASIDAAKMSPGGARACLLPTLRKLSAKR